MLHPDRLLPADPTTRGIARSIYDRTRPLPIVSPHGHGDPWAFAKDDPIGDPTLELVTHDHYLLRMAYSQGVPMEALGVRGVGAPVADVDGRAIWRTFAQHYHLFLGTPSKLWLDHTLAEVFGISVRLDPHSADAIYDELTDKLSRDDFRPRALFDRFDIGFLATTDAALDPLEAHAEIRASGWNGQVVPTFRPDDVIDPDGPRFVHNLGVLADLTGEDTTTWSGYLTALRARRAVFVSAGATASDHGPPSPRTANLTSTEAEALFARVVSGQGDPGDAELFRAHMLVEMASMSLEDGLVLQLHAGAWRRHNPTVTVQYGSDKGADIPRAMNYVEALKPLLDRFGNEAGLTVIIYTLDESTYSRELAPLAGHYPALRLGPPWWFHDSPEGIRRFRQQVTETAGFYNTVGFNDDARSLLSIPARHDVARRIDVGYLAGLVAEHRLDEDEAHDVAADLAYRLARDTFRVSR